MYSHLIAVKVSVESGSHQRMQLNGTAFNQYRFKSLDTKAVQSWCAVQEHGALLDYFFQHFPNLWPVALNVAFCALDVGGVAMFIQAGNHEGSEEFQRHRLWQTTLIQLQMRSNYNDRTPGIIHTFTQQVTAETTFLSLQHIRK